MKEEERLLLNKERRKMRAKVIHLLCLLGYVDEKGSADYNRINQFVQRIGSANPRKVILNYLWKAELLAVTSQIEQIYKKELSRFKSG